MTAEATADKLSESVWFKLSARASMIACSAMVGIMMWMLLYIGVPFASGLSDAVETMELEILTAKIRLDRLETDVAQNKAAVAATQMQGHGVSGEVAKLTEVIEEKFKGVESRLGRIETGIDRWRARREDHRDDSR